MQADFCGYTYDITSIIACYATGDVTSTSTSVLLLVQVDSWDLE